ncbi:ABC transporter permease [Candidatus Woesearchaeota archaeon]|nr:ABC transporter permease [Candidatus Woesearchaeota archaeon]MBT6734845.1 ABC transporter permease [Candidatus Woesearchaeota archaeon]MBT7169640.1 ABC transporter permease [Candidatus Woesearchaeota archaeon]MBT7474598.1 ABC transporter permease [Candidatus Woesearchaeota archaeon]
MINKESMNYSLRNFNKNKGRSLLTIFSILVGITTIFIFISFGYGLYDYTNELTSGSSADKVLIIPKTAGGFGAPDEIILNEDDVDEIKKSTDVLDATGLYYDAVLVKQNSDQKYTFIIGYDPKKDFVMESFNIGADEGRMLKSGDMGKVVLGHNYKIKNKIFDKAYELNDNIELNGIDLKVVGFMEEIGNPQDDSQLYISDSQFEELFTDVNSYGQIIAKVDISELEKVIKSIEHNLRKSRDLEEGKEDFYVQSYDDLIESFTGALNIIVIFIIFIALISVIVSTINTANTMITSVLERYKEIGVLKAMGAKNNNIFEIFLFESSLLGTIAGVFGVIFGWAISYTFGVILDNMGWGFLSPHFSIYLFGGLILFSGITGAISGVFPAIQAAKTNPVDALRTE